MQCADAAFVTNRGLLFSFVPYELLEEARERIKELQKNEAISIHFAVNLEHENGRNYQFEASDILVRIN